MTTKKCCAFCEMDIESMLEIYDDIFVCKYHYNLLELGIIEYKNGVHYVHDSKIEEHGQNKINQSITKNFNYDAKHVSNNIINEINSYSTDNKNNKLYKYILLLSILDYLIEETDLETNNYFNREIKIDLIVNYYRRYLEFDEIRKVSFNNKSNKELINKKAYCDIAAYNKCFKRNILENPVRHMHDCTFLESDDKIIYNSKGKPKRNKETFATYIKLIKPANIDSNTFINSIRIACVNNIKLKINTDSFMRSDTRGRIGQQVYRFNLLEKYKCTCAICGEVFIPAMLVASHAKPWAKCDDTHEQLTVNNGLLLCANHDALFDKGFISINPNTKEILVNNILGETGKRNIPKKFMFEINPLMIKYLSYHNEHVYKQSPQ